MRESRCKYCGARLIWAPSTASGRPIALEAELTGYILTPGGMDALASKEGVPVRGARITPPTAGFREVDGYAHRFHAPRCPGRRRT